MTRSQYTTCKVCRELKEFTELFQCLVCKKILCIEHAPQELAFCPDCWKEMQDPDTEIDVSKWTK